MELAELIGKLVILGAVAAMGFHLIKNNRIITTNLLKTPGLFDTKEVKIPADRPIKKHKLILSRVNFRTFYRCKIGYNGPKRTIMN